MEQKVQKVVIIGGVAGGMACAARLRRLNEAASITVFEKGPDFSFSNCGLPYFIGGEFEDRNGLLIIKEPVLRSRFNLDLRSMTEITSIDRANKKVSFRKLVTGETGEMAYDQLVISTGASPIVPPLPGLPHPRILTLRNMVDMDRIVNTVHEGAKAVVVGGGFVGLEVAEALTHRKCLVEVGIPACFTLPASPHSPPRSTSPPACFPTSSPASPHLIVELCDQMIPLDPRLTHPACFTAIVEMCDQVMMPLDPEMANPLHHELRNHGVALHLKTACKGFRAVGEKLTVDLGAGLITDVDFVILAIGVRPDTAIAQAAGLQLSPRGYLVVDEHMRTSDPAVYAVGDAIQTHDVVLDAPTVLPLAGPAARQGRTAAENICGRATAFRGVQGTAILRLFGMVACCTGANCKTLARAGKPHAFVHLHPLNHVAFMPGKAPLHMKLVYDPTDGRVLGAQIVTAGQGADSRINAVAMAIQGRMTVYDLEQAELAYAPPFSGPKDPVNMAGMLAAGVLRGDQAMTSWDRISPADFVLDVRSPQEATVGPILKGHPVNIPVEQLRSRLAELPRDKPINVTCAVGVRAYLAVRILLQNGFTQVFNITGGHTSMLMDLGMPMPGQRAPQPAGEHAPASVHACCGTAAGACGGAPGCH
ncbi:putative Coenzyme A disulfide reductase [Paratrimastix pyriformis]|uniref:Coenzyme A disulfide reductase n=1 Tax=Paratrimastix pyriformis TaxID=342808 RepID=A0ABQ8U5N0_9EUKA|nr:putative Coenzyme A disulfide reductase [Paratrimastix pyriformis]